jgi:hypothetical protein
MATPRGGGSVTVVSTSGFVTTLPSMRRHRGVERHLSHVDRPRPRSLIATLIL